MLYGRMFYLYAFLLFAFDGGTDTKVDTEQNIPLEWNQ